MTQVTIKWPWPNYEWQVQATKHFHQGIQGSTRNFVWVIARQLGKTTLLLAIMLREASTKGGCFGYFAPSYDRSEEVYGEACEALRDLVDAGLVTTKKTTAGWIIRFSRDLTGGEAGILHFKSLGNAEHLRGMTLNGACVDETGLVEGRVWRKIIDPMLVAKDGWVIFSGTPPEIGECDDPDFFKGLYIYATQSGDRKWWAIHRDYTAHPSKRVRDDILDKQRRMPSEEFNREYLALFPDQTEIHLPPVHTFGERSEVKACPTAQFVATGIDLADSESELGDKASVVTWRVVGSGDIYVVAAEYYRNPSEVLDAVFDHYDKYRPDVVKLQGSAFDKGFRYTLEQAQRVRGIYLPVQMIDLGGASKRRRIMQMEPIAREGKMFVDENLRDLLLEWEQFPDGLHALVVKTRATRRNHYDLLDALSGCVPDSREYSIAAVVKDNPMNSVDACLRALRAKRKGIPVERFFRL